MPLKIAITIWLLTASIWDQTEKRIPNWLLLPVLLVGLVYQIYASIDQRSWAALVVIVAWVVVFGLWQARVFGGADAKLLMALFALYPTQRFLVMLCVAVVGIGIPMLIYDIVQRTIEQRRAEQKDMPNPSAHDAAHGSTGPEDQKLSSLPIPPKYSRPFAWVFALPGIIYTWTIF